MTDVRLITFRSAILARFVKISSCTPSVKKAFAFSSLRFSNGRTAMVFSGTFARAGAALDTAAGLPTAAGDGALAAAAGGAERLDNKYPPRASAATIMTAAATSQLLPRLRVSANAGASF